MVKSEICEFMAVQVPKVCLGLLKIKKSCFSHHQELHLESTKYVLVRCVVDDRKKGGVGWWEGKQEEENDGRVINTI